jgi:hypothetical protein
VTQQEGLTPRGSGEKPAGEGERAPRPTARSIPGAVILAVVALVHLAIALPALNPAPHNGGDNAGYLSLAHSLTSGSGYVETWDPALAPHTKYPPLYPALLAGAMGLGAEAWITFKLLSVLLITVSVTLCFAWVRAQHGMLMASGVSLVLAFSPALLWSSNWILSDPLFLALTLGCLWSFHESDHAVQPAKWILAGCVLAILSTFTRTAGLPLVLAVGMALALARRWRSLAGFAVAFVVPNVLWWLRSRADGQAQYVSEFWMIDPYQPDLGRAGIGDLVARVLENLQGYVFVHIPAGLSPWPQGALTAFGLVLMAAAVAGWVVRIRERRTVVELFTPLYFGLILLWPAVWSGDRFALPLYPLILFYAAEALVRGAKRVDLRLPLAAGVVAGGLLLVPAIQGWRQAVNRATVCRAVVRQDGPFACHGEPFRQFVSAARWIGENLPDGSAVFTRKPRIFYTLSGVRSRTYPLSPDPERFFREARAAGVAYVVLDLVDHLAVTYVGAVLRERPWAFCGLVGVGEGALRTQILGIVEDAVDPGRGRADDITIRLDACPQTMQRLEPRPLADYSASRLPLLARPAP